MWIGILALLIAQFIGGALGPLFVKLGVEQIPPFTFTALRFILASFVFLPFYLKNKEKKLSFKDYKNLSFKSLFFVGNAAFFAIGISYTTLIMSQIIYTLVPVIVLVSANFILHEKLTLQKIIGLFIAFSGVVFLIEQSFVKADTYSFGHLNGNILIILAVISYSFYIVLSKDLQKKYSTTTITFFNLFVAMIFFVLLVPIELWITPFILSKVTIVGIGSVFGAGVILSAFMFFLVQFGIKKTNAFTASLFQYMAPFFASISGILILKERITITLIIGGLLIVIGVFYASAYEQVRKHIKSMLQ